MVWKKMYIIIINYNDIYLINIKLYIKIIILYNIEKTYVYKNDQLYYNIFNKRLNNFQKNKKSHVA